MENFIILFYLFQIFTEETHRKGIVEYYFGNQDFFFFFYWEKKFYSIKNYNNKQLLDNLKKK